jgi:hypothetical protein
MTQNCDRKSVGKVKTPDSRLGDPGPNIPILKYVACNGVDLIHLAQKSCQWKAIVNKVINREVPNGRLFLD